MGPNDLAANGFAVVVSNVEKDPSGGGIVLSKIYVGRGKKERKKSNCLCFLNMQSPSSGLSNETH